VDVGSNTARLLVADVVSGRDVRPVGTDKVYLGLGAEIADTGTLSEETVDQTATTCRLLARRALEAGAVRAEVILTSPGRRKDAGSLVGAIRERTRLPVRVLSADDEGRLAFEGAVARHLGDLPDIVGVVDVGGGSTEITVGTPHAGPGWVGSVELGSLRLTRLALRDDPPGRRKATWARATVHEALSEMRPVRPDLAFAVGGSARALSRIVGRTFSPDTLDEAIAALSRRRSTKVARAYGLEPTRARTLLGGAILLAEAAHTLDRPLNLARGGLREGAALALATEGAAVAA